MTLLNNGVLEALEESLDVVAVVQKNTVESLDVLLLARSLLFENLEVFLEVPMGDV